MRNWLLQYEGFDPIPPEAVQRLHLRLRYRGQWLELDLGKGRLRISIDKDGAEPVRVLIKGVPHSILPGKSMKFPLLQKISNLR